jgi:dienelactone hydrolase
MEQRSLRKTLSVAVLLVAAVALADPGQSQPAEAQAPLEVREHSRQAGPDAAILRISYRGAEGPVSALLVLPPGKGPFPAVLFQHWAQGDKGEFLEEARMLARAGAVSLLVDAPFARPEPYRKPLQGPEVGKMHAQAFTDLRRAVDLLASRPEVDPARLGYVGHSFGAGVGAALSGVEKRLRAFVLMGGTAPAGSAAPSKVFFQFARDDEHVSLDEAEEVIGASSEPKLFKFYAGGHAFNEAARRDRLQWLRTELDFGAIAENGPPMVQPFGITDPSWQRAPPFEVGKLRPVYEVPGQAEVEVTKNLVYKEEDGQRRTLDLYVPPAAQHGALPLVVLVHGSTHPAILRHIKDLPLFEGQARWLAATGLIVAVPSLGSPARGPTPAEWYAGVADVRANLLEALTFLREQAGAHRIDRGRICLMTVSAGGTYGVSPALDAPPSWLKCIVGYYPQLEAPEVPLARELAPLALVKTTRAKVPPLFFVRAGRDYPWLNRSLDSFMREAKRRKLPVTVRELPLAHHSFELVDDAEDSRTAMRESVKFLHAQLAAPGPAVSTPPGKDFRARGEQARE